MKAILDSNPVLMSVYVGYDSGAFHSADSNAGQCLPSRELPGTGYDRIY